MANDSLKRENSEASIKANKSTSRSINGKKNSFASSFGFNRSVDKERNIKGVNTLKDLKSSHEKFSGNGISFKGKLIGIDPVSGPSGDKMCQEAMQRLKTIIKGTGSHKQRIIIQISLNGVRISDEKGGELVSHHSIPLISYISRDVSDNRAFGFVYGSPESGHQFIGIKTEKFAVPIMRAIGELFNYVYELKNKEKRDAVNFNDEKVTNKISSTLSNNNRKEKKEAESPPLPPPRDESSMRNTHDNSACFDHLFLNMSNIRDVINSVKEASDPYANWESFNDDVSSNVKANLFEKLENNLSSTTSVPSLNEFVKIEPPSTLSRKSKAKLKTQEFNLDNCDQAFEVKEEKVPSNLNNEAKVEKDRYAAFSEIHSMTSIFDSIVPQTQDNKPVISEFANFERNFDNNLNNQDSQNVDCTKDNFTESNSIHQLSDKINVNYPLAPLTLSSSLNFQETRPFSSASRNPFLSDSLSESSDDLFPNSPSIASPVPSLNTNLSNNNANSNISSISNSNSSNSYINGNDNCEFEKSNFSTFFDTNQDKSFSQNNPLSSSYYTTANSTTNESSKDALSYFGISWAQEASSTKTNSPLSNSSLNSPTNNATSNIFADPFLDNCECPPPAPPPRPRPRESPSIASFSSTSSDTPPPPVPPRPLRNDNSITIPPPPLPKRKPTINSNQCCSIQSPQNSAFAPPLPLPQRKAQQIWSKEGTLFTSSNSWQSNSKSPDSQEFDPFNCAFLDQDLESFKSQQSINSNNNINTNIITNNSNSNLNSSNSSGNILKKDNKITSQLSNVRLSSENLDKHSTPKQTLNQGKFNFEDVSQLSTIPTPTNQDLNSIDFSFSTTDPTLSSVFDSVKESKEENKSSNHLNNSENKSSKVKSDPFEDDFFQ